MYLHTSVLENGQDR